MLVTANRIKWDVYRAFLDPMSGCPILFVLIVIGLFREPWPRHHSSRKADGAETSRTARFDTSIPEASPRDRNPFAYDS